MRPWLIAAAVLFLSQPAHAIGCFTGGVAGAIVGHMAHHSVLGAIGGCIAGHHYNKQQKQEQQEQQQRDQRPSRDNDVNL